MNLPPTSSSFIGRQSDIARLLELFASPSRVVTLLGPAGIGKTRLATHVAREAMGTKRTWFVALAEARSESTLVSAVAAALGDSTGDVGHALEDRGEILVVLDNVEQVVSAAAHAIAGWVRVAPCARFLVTSRERLRIECEAVLDLEPLAQEDAVRLFVNRAAVARGRFAPDESEAHAIADLVRRLDGNPLAIELAAARTKLFSAIELLARLDKRFELLTGRRRDQTVRHGSLRGAIDWSWELLTDPEKRGLARCAVFSGGFSIEAAEAVLGDGGLQCLESLVDKSLVRRHDGRFALDETVRDYAAGRLTELGEEDEARSRHAAFYTELARTRADALRGEHALSAAASFRIETDNVLAAHRRLRGRERGAAASVALALNTLVALRGPIDIQRELVDAAVEDAAGIPELHVRALVASGRAHLVRGEASKAKADATCALEVTARVKRDDDTPVASLRALALELSASVDLDRGRAESARSDAREALELYVRDRDRAGEASALFVGAVIDWKQGRLDDSREGLQSALAIQRQLGDKIAMMGTLGVQGLVHHLQDRADEAKRCHRAALDLAVALGDRRVESNGRANLGLLLIDEGDLDEARDEIERAQAIQRASGYRQNVGNTTGSLGTIDLVEGNAASARRRFEESLSIFRELGHRRYEAVIHQYLGIVALEEGDLDRALRSLGLAHAAAEEVGDFTSLVDGPLGATLALLGRDADSEEAFARARMSLVTRGEPRAFVLLEIFEAFALVARRDFDAARAVVARTSEKRLAADARIARRLLGSAIARNDVKGTTAISVGEEARWFRVGATERVDLSKRRAARLILRRLVDAHRTTPSRGVTLDELIAAGWPGEKIQTEAAAARAYTAIKILRELGLADVLQRRDDGYVLDPAVKLES